VPYEVSLGPDLDRGGHRYKVLVSGDVDEAGVRELSEWVAAARQNPDARFEIDIDSASVAGRRAQNELRALMRMSVPPAAV
jgi:hypothetical protein